MILDESAVPRATAWNIIVGGACPHNSQAWSDVVGTALFCSPLHKSNHGQLMIYSFKTTDSQSRQSQSCGWPLRMPLPLANGVLSIQQNMSQLQILRQAIMVCWTHCTLNGSDVSQIASSTSRGAAALLVDVSELSSFVCVCWYRMSYCSANRFPATRQWVGMKGQIKKFSCIK